MWILAVFSLFAVLASVGVPIFYSLALATTLGMVVSINVPLGVMVQKMLYGIDSFVILAVPLYILAGAIMEKGGIASRLVGMGIAIVGWIRGGLAMAVVVVEYLFSGISGSTAADVSAVGSMLIPSMARAGYSRQYAVAVVSAASSMGMLVPPCINMVVAGGLTNISVGALFIGGFIPAIVLAILILMLIYWQARRFGWGIAEERMTLSKFGRACRRALIPLGMPLIIFGGILGGIVTPTEAGMLAVVYALVVELFIYREIHLRDLYKVFLEAGITSGVIGILVAIASVFAWLMTVQKIPEAILKGILSLSTSPYVFMVLSTVVFMIIGCFLEGLPAIVVLLPTMIPITYKLGIHPIYYINVMIAATGIGIFLPPVGIGVLIACSVGKVDITSAARALFPFLIMLLIGLLIMIVFPEIILMLPRFVGMIQ